MDLSKLHNPYDFSNPVSNPELFIGRDKELEEIKYYLDQSRKAPRAVNLALIGARASGKTSLLNMIDNEACDNGFLVIRIDLDESDAQSQIAFFHKFFDALLTTACQEGAFGGLSGQTYDVFRSMVDAYEIPESKTFCPLAFPLQYARAMEKGNYNATVSDVIFKRDLSIISTEVNKPIAILLDECDVLTRSRIHLQKIRNIFMNIAGYMLVFTGTPALFPIMNDVFSPIIRQFKKINVGPFVNEQDTEDLIKSPLIKIGIEEPNLFLDSKTFQEVKDIHNLSNGHPYEIQLICHFLFKRVQTGRAKKMELSLEVLDDVLKELQTTQDVSTRKIITDVKSLPKQQLRALNILCMCNGQINFEQAFFIKEAFLYDFKYTRDDFSRDMSIFKEKGIININENIISFAGDDFDKIYCKYLSRKQGISFNLNDYDFEGWITVLLSAFVQEDVPHIELLPVFSTGDIPSIEAKKVRDMICSEDTPDPFEQYPDFAQTIYWASLDNQHKEMFQMAHLTLTTPWSTTRQWFTIEDELENSSSEEELFSYIDTFNVRIRQLDCHIDVKVDYLEMIPSEILFNKLINSGNVRLRTSVILGHRQKMYTSHFEDNDREGAYFHAYLTTVYSKDADDLNNYGYLCLIENELQNATIVFDNALERVNETAKPDLVRALISYNMGILKAKQEDYSTAIELLEACIILSQKVKEEDKIIGCLLLPKIDEEGLDFIEIRKLGILDVNQQAIKELRRFIDSKSTL